MTFFYIARFIGMIEFYHTIPFLMDVLGLVLTMSLALTQVCWQQRKHFERIKMQKRDLSDANYCRQFWASLEIYQYRCCNNDIFIHI